MSASTPITLIPERWSRGALEVVASCPACHASEIAERFHRRDDALVLPDHWSMVRCAACGSLYLNPRPDEASLPRAYEDYYTHHADSDVFVSDGAGIVAALVNGYLNRRFCMRRKYSCRLGAWLFPILVPLRLKLDVYGRHLPKTICGPHTRLLDVGCGNGAFLLRAREIGIDVEGCEPDVSAVNVCRNAGLSVIQGDAFAKDLDGRRYDVITLNHVIEHVRDAQSLLDRLHELLRPGGLIWMALPNPTALGVHVFHAAWKGFHPPFHLVIPSQRILLDWMVQAGFHDAHCVRRGAQSQGLWRESLRIAQREGCAPSRISNALYRLLGDVLSTVFCRWSEETIVMAWKPGEVAEPLSMQIDE